ncbi:MAG: cupin domain-containing protein, partial [Phycisphaerae bacterium]|nr:cupin domain-containing protein [Phycisphaerae bacterium]
MSQTPVYKFRLEAETPRVSAGGTAREATVSKFPASTGLAGVSMRCKPGGLRELHWHANAAEWAYVISGTCRTTIVHPDGTRASDDFGPGDVWYFPRGYPHCIEATGTEECHFILVFDNGSFSENATFSLTDWLSQTPRHILAAHLHLSDQDLDRLPKGEAYIPLGPVAPAREEPPIGAQRPTSLGHRYPLGAQPPAEYSGGSLRIVSRNEFPISTTMAGGLLHLQPGGVREMHWHPTANEWQYIVKGSIRMTVFESQGKSQTVDLQAGDVG